MMVRVGLLLALLSVSVVAPSRAEARRVALVIGNANYVEVGKLGNPLKDADLVAASLRRAGFDSVDVKRNLGKAPMEAALREFGDKADGAEVALIYYAGHGVEAGGQNYLIPVDAKLARDRDLEVEATRLDTVLRLVEGARLRVVVLDACRNNPFVAQMQRSAKTRSIGRGLAAVEPEGETLVVYAAKAGATAADGDGGNSPFAEALAKRLPQPGLEISLLFRTVRDDVLTKTARTQEPFSYGSLSGTEFFFVAPNGKPPVPTVQTSPAVTAPSNEALHWQGALSADTESAYRNYLRRFPKGEFAELAAENIKRLNTKVAVAQPSAAAPAAVSDEKKTAGKGFTNALTQIARALSPEQATQQPQQSVGPPAQVAGVWQGSYSCGQGLSAMQLMLEQAYDGSLRARLDFTGTQVNPGPTGAYTLSGRIVNAHLQLRAEQWLMQPPGYSMVDIEGDVAADQLTLSGRILNPACGGWSVSKVRS
jgi:Caspase domain